MKTFYRKRPLVKGTKNDSDNGGPVSWTEKPAHLHPSPAMSQCNYFDMNQNHPDVDVVGFLGQVPNCMQSRTLEGVRLDEGEPSQSSKAADRKLLQRMFPGSYGDKLLQVQI